MACLFLLLALFFASLGQVFYKGFANESKKIFLSFAIIFFILTPFCNFLALRSITVDVVYMATSLNSFIILLLSAYILKEQVTKKQIIGTLIIFIGVVIYGVKL